MNIGIPKKRTGTAVPEKYPNTPVIHMNAAPTEKGHTWRFKMNPTAMTLLGFDKVKGQSIQFANNDDGFYFIKSDTPGYRVSKVGVFTNRPLHRFLTDKLGLDETKTHDLSLSLYENTVDGKTYYQISVIDESVNTLESTTVEPVTMEPTAPDNQEDTEYEEEDPQNEADTVIATEEANGDRMW